MRLPVETPFGPISVDIDDEVVAEVGEAGIKEVLLEAVKDLRKAGKTVILVTHRPSVLAVADLIVLMQSGKIVRCGARDEVLSALRSESTRSVAVSPT